MAQAVTNLITERVIRGPVANTADVLTFVATAIERIGRTPSGDDFTDTTDFLPTGGQVDWSPAGSEPRAGEAYFVRYSFVPPSSFKDFDQVALEMGVTLEALQPTADAKPGSVIRNAFIDVPGRQVTDLFRQAQRLAATQSLKDVTQFEGTELDDYAFNFGEVRGGSEFSTGFLQFNAAAVSTEPILIPSGSVGTTLSSSSQGPISFRTTADTTLFPGETAVLVPIQAEVAGSAGNVGAASIVNLATPILGITSITNPNPTAGGRDLESDEEFAERLRSTFLANDKGTFRGIRRESLGFENVIDALVVGAGDPLLVRGGGVGGKVDLYIQAEAGFDRAVEAPEDHIYNGDDIILTNQPVVGVSLVTINAVPTSNYALVKDTGDLAESTRAVDAVRILSGAVGGDTIGITYSYNGLLNDIQTFMDAEENALPARDLLTRAAARVFIDVTVSIVPETGLTFEDVQAAVVNAVASLINEKKLGAEISYSDVFDAVRETDGVRDVRPLALLTRTGQGTAETIQLGANEFPESGAIVVRRA